MAKATYGFKANEWNEHTATLDATRRATEDGILTDYKGNYTTEKVQTAEHVANGEFCIVIRTSEEA